MFPHCPLQYCIIIYAMSNYFMCHGPSINLTINQNVLSCVLAMQAVTKWFLANQKNIYIYKTARSSSCLLHGESFEFTATTKMQKGRIFLQLLVVYSLFPQLCYENLRCLYMRRKTHSYFCYYSTDIEL